MPKNQPQFDLKWWDCAGLAKPDDVLPLTIVQSRGRGLPKHLSVGRHSARSSRPS